MVSWFNTSEPLAGRLFAGRHDGDATVPGGDGRSAGEGRRRARGRPSAVSRTAGAASARGGHGSEALGRLSVRHGSVHRAPPLRRAGPDGPGEWRHLANPPGAGANELNRHAIARRQPDEPPAPPSVAARRCPCGRRSPTRPPRGAAARRGGGPRPAPRPGRRSSSRRTRGAHRDERRRRDEEPLAVDEGERRVLRRAGHDHVAGAPVAAALTGQALGLGPQGVVRGVVGVVDGELVVGDLEPVDRARQRGGQLLAGRVGDGRAGPARPGPRRGG
jgi:hypothetical protein